MKDHIRYSQYNSVYKYNIQSLCTLTHCGVYVHNFQLCTCADWLSYILDNAHQKKNNQATELGTVSTGHERYM